MQTKLRKLEAQKQRTSHGSDDYDDTYGQVMGKGKGSHMHLVGLGPSPADVWGQKPSPYSLMRMGLEAKRSANEEVSKMLNKMEAMEQKYASLEAQIVKMTSNMENLIDKMGALGSKQVSMGIVELNCRVYSILHCMTLLFISDSFLKMLLKIYCHKLIHQVMQFNLMR